MIYYDEEKMIASMIRDLYETVSKRQYYGIITHQPDPNKPYYETDVYAIDTIRGYPANYQDTAWYASGEGRTRAEAMLECLDRLVTEMLAMYRSN